MKKMELNRKKQFTKDIFIYGIGVIGNKFLSAFLFPVLSFFMVRAEMGSYDVAFEAIMFLLPVITLQMHDSNFRFLIDNNDPTYRKHLLSSTLFIEVIMFGIVLLVALVLPFFLTIRYFHLIVLSIYAYSLYEFYTQAIRSIYSSTQYTLISIYNSSLTVILVFLFYFVFKLGIEGLFWGNIVARILSILIIELPRRKLIGSLSVRFIKKEHIKAVLRYSLPLMFAAVALGAIASPGKFIVNYFYGDESNGILVMAQKYMNVLLALGAAFNLAWQVTAIKNFNKPDSSAFFSEVFNKYTLLLCLIVLCIPFGLRAFPFLIGAEFHQSIGLLYIYCASSLFYCLALFLEVIYQCAKKTHKTFYSIITCAAFAPFLTVVCTKYFGLMGNLAALTIAYLYLFVFRFFQTKSTLPILLKKEFYFSMLVLIGGGVIFHALKIKIVDFAVLFLAVVLLGYFVFFSGKRLFRAAP